MYVKYKDFFSDMVNSSLEMVIFIFNKMVKGGIFDCIFKVYVLLIMIFFLIIVWYIFKLSDIVSW